jgi:hypothetical protein
MPWESITITDVASRTMLSLSNQTKHTRCEGCARSSWNESQRERLWIKNMKVQDCLAQGIKIFMLSEFSNTTMMIACLLSGICGTDFALAMT